MVDVQLAGTSGLELLEKVRFESPHVRVILLTTLPAEDVTQRAWQWRDVYRRQTRKGAELFGKTEEAFARETIEQF